MSPVTCAGVRWFGSFVLTVTVAFAQSAFGSIRRYYVRDWMNYDNVASSPLSSEAASEAIRESLESAVKRQLMSDVPYGVLLSGGLDSSVISAIAQRFAPHRLLS